MQYKGYYATVNFNAADEVFFGKIAGISDLVSFEGESVKDLKKAFQEAVDDYIETCETLGKEPGKAYKGSFNVRVDPSLHKEAAFYSAANNITLNEFIKRAINYALNNEQILKKTT